MLPNGQTISKDFVHFQPEMDCSYGNTKSGEFDQQEF